jgi:phenylalanyl-tRNA synthetase beta chain
MKISYNWLKTYLPDLESLDIDKLSNKIYSALAEVENIDHRGKGLSRIVVGEIIDTKNHPENNKLMVASVNIGSKKNLTILFAAENQDLVNKGDFYPVCLPGGTIYNPSEPFGSQIPMEIIEREINGIVSEGILCSPRELGIFDEKRGVSILGSTAKNGEDLLPILNDFVFEIENKSLTHRPDCFSHRGIAREIAAITGLNFIDKDEAILPIQSGNKPIKITLQENSVCQRFCSVSMENVSIESSPAWIQIRLAYTGIRPINNIVDISNYIMTDIGYPIHIYDYDKLKKPELVVRKAQKEEIFIGLNENTYKLNPDMVVIESGGQVEDLAGIMGGENSEITKETKNIVIESASFDMYNIRKTSMTLGLVSEASTRFSKGIDGIGTEETVKRVATLVEELTGGEVASQFIDINKQNITTKKIRFNFKLVKRLLGIDIGKDKIIDILESLNIEIEGGDEAITPSNDLDIDTVLVIPYYRKDLNIQEDIIEEIARIYGYANFVPEYPTRTIRRAKINPIMVFGRRITDLLTKSGLDEVKSYSFVSQELWKKAELSPEMLVKLKNPLSPELSLLRDSLLPSIIEKSYSNMKNYDNFGIFEISRVTEKNQETLGLNNQPYKISGAYTSRKSVDSFEKLKSMVAFVLSNLNIDFQLKRSIKADNSTEWSLYHPNKTVSFIHNKQIVAMVGEINPLVQSNFNLSQNSLSIFNIDHQAVRELYESKQSQYRGFSMFPTTKRDVNIWLKERTEVGTVIQFIKDEKIQDLSEIEAIDLYREGDKTSLTLRFTIGNNDYTMSEEQINETYNSIISIIENKLHLDLRRD